jgi:hypothetical protein
VSKRFTTIALLPLTQVENEVMCGSIIWRKELILTFLSPRFQIRDQEEIRNDQSTCEEEQKEQQQFQHFRTLQRQSSEGSGRFQRRLGQASQAP